MKKVIRKNFISDLGNIFSFFVTKFVLFSEIIIKYICFGFCNKIIYQCEFNKYV